MTTKIKDTVLRNIKKLPFVRRRIESEFKQVLQSFEKEHLSVSGHLDDIVTLPEDGRSVSEVLDLAQSYVNLGKETWKDGSGSGTCYGVSEDLVKLNTDVTKSNFQVFYMTYKIRCKELSTLGLWNDCLFKSTTSGSIPWRSQNGG